jgi:site-specific recombinase XerC
VASYTPLPNGKIKAIIRRAELGTNSKGKQRALTKTLPSQAAAERWAREIETGLDTTGSSAYADMRDAKVGGILLAFRDEEVPKRKGQRHDVHRINKFLRQPWAMLDLTQDVTGALITWRDKAMKPENQGGYGLAPGTVRRDLNLIHAAFEWARTVKRLKMGENPVKGVARPSDGGRRDRLWDQEDLSVFLDKMGFDMSVKPEKQGDKVGWILLLARTTGWRLSEICKIQNQTKRQAAARTFVSERGYIDLTVPEVYFPPTEERNGVKVGGTKNDAGFKAPLREDAVKVIKALLAHFPTPAKQDYGVAPPTLLGIGTDSAGEFYRRWRTEVAKDHPELANIKIHEIRHTWTTEMCKAIPDQMAMLAISGRKSLTSLKHYYHPDAQHLVGLMNKVPGVSVV